jgi:hypothetical protein
MGLVTKEDFRQAVKDRDWVLVQALRLTLFGNPVPVDVGCGCNLSYSENEALKYNDLTMFLQEQKDAGATQEQLRNIYLNYQ